MADKNTLVLTKIATPFGELLAGASEKGICLLEFTDTERLKFQIPRLEKNFSCKVSNGDSPFFAQLKQQLTAYFQGEKDCFSDIPLDLKGTEFQMKAWQALRAIPYGETRSYQQQAEAIDKPKAVRAVASANRNNRISILIPCHRVIGKNGKMAGYGGGIWRKEFLLKLEGSLSSNE
jgi:O-6-methylguanine DNA methyltransferase